ncbi:hypothetical protein BB387_00605 [Helicobacter pylori]|uniref:hypothetical protein n=1 Tax=Helicobacter pylori TaxID=210 RepID=UPI000BECB2BE|nr:hypothetical protein [Helicobacter pylori]PDW13357.1 hypothetical protein BB387_00605 [Helicobacter pylori]
MENTPKDRVKILIEELKILQGIINRMAQNSLECKKWTLALAVGVLSIKIEAIFNSYGLCVFGGVIGMLLSFRRLLSHARKIIQGAIPMADRKPT